MNIIFFGTSDFARGFLEALLSSSHKIVACVTTPDAKKGRGQKIVASPVKIFAQKEDLVVLEPQQLTDAQFLKSLKAKPADLFVVCAYGRILTKEILQIPQKYAINLHASLLPKYRGAAPINWAIIRGETQTGITIFKMNEQMDEGEIILQAKTGILPVDSAISLSEKLARIGKDSLLQALGLIEQNQVSLIAQDESQVSFAPKLKKEDGLINWRLSSDDIYNRIRGLKPWPGAFTYLKNRLLKIWQAEAVKDKRPGKKRPGAIIALERKGILVEAGAGQVLLTELQLEGKKRMSAEEFILGQHLLVGQKLGK